MADTYGSRDANRFEVNKVQYYTLVDAKTGLITVKSPTVAGYVGGANADRTVGTIPATGANKGKFQFLAGNTTTEENAYFSKPENTKALKNQAEITANKAQQKEGVSPAAANARTNELLDNGKANTPTSADPDAAKVDKAQEDAIKKESESFLGGTREEYSDAKYPLNLKAEKQDCIKFTIIKYKPSGLSTAQKSNGRVVTVENNRPIVGKEFLGTITLPIPGGIIDQNVANWTPDSLDTLMKGGADVVSKFIGGGADAAGAAAKSDLGGITGGGGGSLESYVTAKATEGALGGSANVLGRQFGAVSNPNMELLFSGPALRSFSFTFKMSPREEIEAKEVRKIIRYFKQAMSAKRSQSTLLLKSPFTFAISYISGNKQHPYLNKFKECALTNCNVNYTPYGTYMTYAGEPSMVAYELQLQFQELEPLFDDEYGAEKDITNIGF
jgi:hypothetical protein